MAHGLVKFKDLEEWQKDNPLIETGYRRLQGSYFKCLKTIPRLHNETVNIWTHLVGAFVAVFTLAFFLFDLGPSSTFGHGPSSTFGHGPSSTFGHGPSSTFGHGRQGWFAPFSSIPFPIPHVDQPSVEWADTVGFIVFLVSAATCLGLSALFHTFVCHSMKVAHAWNRMDYIGIVVLISGTFVPATRYGFFCDPHLRNFYISIIYLASAATIYVVISPNARTPSFRRLRTWLFISLGLSAVFPVGHAIYRYGMEQASANISLFWLTLGGALYIIGALLYAERTPERFAPGRFDLFGSSHQIFHVMILLAAWSHWTGITEGFRFHHGERGGVCPGREL